MAVSSILLKSLCSSSITGPLLSKLDRISSLVYLSLVMQKNQPSSEQKRIIRATSRQRIVAGLIFLGIAGFWLFCFLVANEHVEIERMLGLCGFKQRHGLPCPSCGMTTATLAFSQGAIFRSFYIQPVAALGCFVLALTAFFSFLTAVFGIYFSIIKRFFAEVRMFYLILAVVVIIACGWAVTLARALAEK